MASSDFSPVLRFVVPGDPGQNTGGYRYVRRAVDAINELGTRAVVTGLAGQFPRPDQRALAAMNHCLEQCPDSAVVVLDGLAIGAMPQVIEEHAQRLKLIALIHHPLADETGLSEEERQWFFEQERRALAAVAHVVTTSAFTVGRLAAFGVSADRIDTAHPGVAIKARLQTNNDVRRAPVPQLLCVGHLSQRKAQHQLVKALQNLQSLPWHCTLAGSLDRDSAYSQEVANQIRKAGLEGRVELTGEVAERRLLELYQQADVFVFPSLYEGYGMVIDEAIASGLPVITSDGGALANTGDQPGVLQYPAGDVEALESALRAWLSDPEGLAQQTTQAQCLSSPLRTWENAAQVFLKVAGLGCVAAGSVFENSWLELRESADHQARSMALTEAVDRWLHRDVAGQVDAGSREPVTIVDLGTGRGSNAVFLAPRLLVPKQWLLLDHDASLLTVAKDRLTQLGESSSVAEAWLTADSLAAQIPSEARLITASALIDLVSEEWLDALVASAGSQRAALLVTLSYSGQFRLEPEHPCDERVQTLVNQHQRGEKGTGRALGPDAPRVLAKKLKQAGHSVEISETPWRLNARDRALISQLLEGWVAAAAELAPDINGDGSEWLSDWLSDRKRWLAEGRLSVSVHHLDLMALPPDQIS
ncbi:glycosyltransferase family 4 protein [Marinobacter sediminum]|uniref:glycosyltransferase family 4 protein n=1 Tax=Marinobacter sediminum TaxID=256323 RepID=UPI0019393952|nr:glycosyltransferase [Marinobacter sediminum]